jgi:hypothetical protein
MLSVYIAIYRVYPMLKDYIFSKGLCAYPAIEIYSKDIEVEIVLIYNRIFYLFKPFVPNFETLNPFLLESLEKKKFVRESLKLYYPQTAVLKFLDFVRWVAFENRNIQVFWSLFIPFITILRRYVSQ